MPFVTVSPELPGIVSLMVQFPHTTPALNQLAEVLLRQEDPATLSPADRETIAAFVSSRNNCEFCCNSHTAFAAHQMPGSTPLDERYALLSAVKQDYRTAPISDKLKALLAIAEQVQKGGLHVTEQTIDAARALGATDRELHDTVLIAAAFCMYNRYVDGLRTIAPKEQAAYDMMARKIVAEGYSV